MPLFSPAILNVQFRVAESLSNGANLSSDYNGILDDQLTHRQLYLREPQIAETNPTLDYH